MNFLLDVGGEADLSDFVEIVEPYSSSFSELFLEQEKMRVTSRLVINMKLFQIRSVRSTESDLVKSVVASGKKSMCVRPRSYR